MPILNVRQSLDPITGFVRLLRLFSVASFCLLVILTGVAFAQGLSPEESLKRMQVPNGLRADLVACEPLIRQPVAIDWDDRGRLWVMQYLQYPNPEGLERKEVDRYSRTIYDVIPKAPPHGPRGSDRLTILSDTDGDGKMDQAHDFVDGLNLASGFAFGHGGVFVLNVPYLLFYPDQDRDDRPDSDPQVLLEGFGMQDAHSVANSLCFGPDGWLYGCQGSTVTANIRGIEFQQGIWRYHPKSKVFELFCEGGGNSWGLDFDPSGELLYSTNYGGYILVHGVQGAYYVKSFAKHGELHNPYAFGYFPHAPHENFTGGHVTVGGIVYQADRLGPEYRGKYLAADLLGHGAHWHHLKPNGSTFSTAHGGSLLQSNDPWFAPSDLTCGPDGAIYIADWHDARMAHPDPDAQWDRSNGRVYRITSADAPSSIAPADLSKLDDQALLDRLNSSDQWHVRRARQELVRRYANVQNPQVHPPEPLLETLRQTTITSHDPQKALEAFWTWTCLASLSDAEMSKLLASPHACIRRWCIRWIGDQEVLGGPSVSSQLAHQLDELAEKELDIHVRQQLACTAARLAPSIAMPIINANINRSIDLQDPYMPLLWWWAVERHCMDGNEEVIRRFVRPTLWNSQLGRDKLLGLLVRRLSAESSSPDRMTLAQNSLVRLLQAAPSQEERIRLWNFVDEGLQTRVISNGAHGGTSFTKFSEQLLELLSEDLKAHPRNLSLLRISMRHELPMAKEFCNAAIDSCDPNDAILIGYIDALTTDLEQADIARIKNVLNNSSNQAVCIKAVEYLAKFDHESLISFLIEYYLETKSQKVREGCAGILLSRNKSALKVLEQIEAGRLSPETIPLDLVRRLSDFNDPQIDILLTKHWGRLKGSTPEEKLAEVRRLNNDLRAGTGNRAKGMQLFQQHCASCHKLFGQGQEIGPDLTSANRKDREYMLVSIVDPSSVIRREYVSMAIRTTDQRVLTGLVKDNGNGKLTIQPQQGQAIEVSRDEIEEIKTSDVSLMPEDLYRRWSPQELRDLFEYLQSDGIETDRSSK